VGCLQAQLDLSIRWVKGLGATRWGGRGDGEIPGDGSIAAKAGPVAIKSIHATGPQLGVQQWLRLVAIAATATAAVSAAAAAAVPAAAAAAPAAGLLRRDIDLEIATVE